MKLTEILKDFGYVILTILAIDCIGFILFMIGIGINVCVDTHSERKARTCKKLIAK